MIRTKNFKRIIGILVIIIIVRLVFYVVPKINSISQINGLSLFVAITGSIILIMYFYKKK